jgi:predicted  nucleic acid-binding Zn-ribbon protein
MTLPMKRIPQFQVSSFRLQVLFPWKIFSREEREGCEGTNFHLCFSSRSSRDRYPLLSRALTWPRPLVSLNPSMLDTIEKLLILQDRDRKINRMQQELAQIAPERESLRAKAGSTQAQLDAAKNRVKQIESERKQRNLEVEAKKSQIEKYANQQLQTRKNEEYKALAHEIEMAKEAIFKIEDAEIVLMEQAEVAQKEVIRATLEANEAKKLADSQIAELGQREENFKKELAELQQGRAELAAAVDESARNRYDRILKSKGDNAVVGIDHGVCGGCHMKLQQQLIVMCQAQKELVTCSSCGRILYYTRDMELTGEK